MFRPDEQQSNRQLICELRNGHAIPPKCIDKIDNCWHTIDHESRRLVNKDYGQKLDAERSRRHDIILQLIYEEAREKEKYIQLIHSVRYLKVKQVLVVSILFVTVSMCLLQKVI